MRKWLFSTLNALRKHPGFRNCRNCSVLFMFGLRVLSADPNSRCSPVFFGLSAFQGLKVSSHSPTLSARPAMVLAKHVTRAGSAARAGLSKSTKGRSRDQLPKILKKYVRSSMRRDAAAAAADRRIVLDILPCEAHGGRGAGAPASGLNWSTLGMSNRHSAALQRAQRLARLATHAGKPACVSHSAARALRVRPGSFLV